MHTYRMRSRERKRFRLAQMQPDLFDWQLLQLAIDPAAMPRIARKVAKRFALPLHHARLISELAGFAQEASNHG